MLENLLMAGIGLLTTVTTYYARKAHRTELDLAVLRGEVERDRANSEVRHNETMSVMREMRDDVRDVRRVLLSEAAR